LNPVASLRTLGSMSAGLAAYDSWAAAVRAAGGVAINSMGIDVSTGHVTAEGNAAAARYPASVWVPQVNARVWAQPDAYDRTGQYGYYLAPWDAQAGATESGQGTDAEAAKVIAQSSWWEDFKLSLKAIGVPTWVIPVGLAVVAAPIVVPVLAGAARAIARRNPPPRRHRHRRRRLSRG
jgi:hypothetical protein